MLESTDELHLTTICLVESLENDVVQHDLSVETIKEVLLLFTFYLSSKGAINSDKGSLTF